MLTRIGQVIRRLQLEQYAVDHMDLSMQRYILLDHVRHCEAAAWWKEAIANSQRGSMSRESGMVLAGVIVALFLVAMFVLMASNGGRP